MLREAVFGPARPAQSEFRTALAAIVRALGERAATPQVAPALSPSLAALARIDPRSITPARLDALHEALLGSTALVRVSASGEVDVELALDAGRRRATGSFFTPAALVKHVVQVTLGPVVEARLAAIEQALTDPAADTEALFASPFHIRVLDPAMGTGRFLLAAAEYLTERLREFYERVRPADGDCSAWIRRQVLEHCLWGIDIDPSAVEVARQSLRLAASAGSDSPAALERHLICADALLDARADDFPQRFEAIVGNPPYGAALDAPARRAVARRWPLARSNSDTAVAFMAQAAELVAPDGRVGLIVPKALTYSYAWRHVRAALREQVVELIDLGRAWPEVRLEQLSIVWSGRPQRATYHARGWLTGSPTAGVHIDRALALRYDTLPTALDAAAQRLLSTLHSDGRMLGDICTTFRGLPLQRRLAAEGDRPVVGGRDLERYAVRSVSGYAMTDTIDRPERFERPKLVFQNIVAHIQRPTPHIRLIGAYDDSGLVTLDTVNNLVPAANNVELLAVLALLHSQFANWFMLHVIYNGAIRTMHFDHYFMRKLPLPAGWDRLQAPLAAAARTCIELPERREASQRSIDEMVARAYGVDRTAALQSA